MTTKNVDIGQLENLLGNNNKKIETINYSVHPPIYEIHHGIDEDRNAYDRENGIIICKCGCNIKTAPISAAGFILFSPIN